MRSVYRISRAHCLVAALGFALFLVAPSLWAEGFNVSFSRAIGGPLNADDPDPGVVNLGYQLGFSFNTAPRTAVAFRLGQVDFEGELFGRFAEPDLTYLTLAGEYTLSGGFYESGVYIGLGGYRLEGDTTGGLSDEESAFGLVVGTTGKFPIYRRLSSEIELSGHYAALGNGSAQIFVFLTVGFGFDF